MNLDRIRPECAGNNRILKAKATRRAQPLRRSTFSLQPVSWKSVLTAKTRRTQREHSQQILCDFAVKFIDHAVVSPWNARARKRKSTMLPSWGCSQFN